MNNKILKIFNLLNSQRKSAGFTLVELLIAALLTTTVVGITGFGMVAITQNNKQAKAETERRVELNRAMDFISDEVRQASSVATDASTNLSGVAPGFKSSGKTPIITLAIPGVSQRVIYYTASASSPWLGPNVIYRWGPSFYSNGKYKNANNVPVAGNNNPANWKDEALADAIDNTGPSSNPCANGWSLNPRIDNWSISQPVKGFYACVDPNGKIAKIHLRAKLNDGYGNPKAPFEVNTRAFARSKDQTAPTLTLIGPPASDLNKFCWPPDHQMQEITITPQVSDNADTKPVVEVVSVVSNERLNGKGDGNTDYDYEIISPTRISLRCERSGPGQGRVYTITYKATDSDGNVAMATYQVKVVHDQSSGG